MFTVLFAFLPEAERVVSAEYDLFGTKHSCDARNDGFIRRSCRIVEQLAKVMTRFVLAFAFAKSSLDSPSQKRNGSAHVGRYDFKIWIPVEKAAQRESG